MFSKPLFKRIILSNYKVWLIITAVLCLYMTVVCATFTPEALGDMSGLIDNMGAMGNLFGPMDSVIGFIGQTFYGLIAAMFPMVYCIVVGNRLIAAQVDKGSMAYLLATPTKRRQITLTSALFLVLSLAVMYGVLLGCGFAVCAAVQPGELDTPAFLRLNLGSFLLAFAVSGICFACSCICNTSRRSIAFGTGIPLAFFLFSMMADLSEDLAFLDYLSLNTLFDPEKAISGDGWVLPYLILAFIGAALYAVGVQVFKEKDLPI